MKTFGLSNLRPSEFSVGSEFCLCDVILFIWRKPNFVSICLYRMIEEFERQLKLYQAMGCEVDTSSAIYKQYRLQKVTEKYPGEWILLGNLFLLVCIGP